MSQISSSISPTLRGALISRSTVTSNIALITAGVGFLAAMAQLAFPLPGSPVPVTGQTLAVLLIGTSYGANLGTLTTAIYVVLGVTGLPFFTQGSHGLTHLTGATGGYLIGMILASYLSGALANKKWDRNFSTVIPTMIISNSLIFLFGLIWLQHTTAQSWNWTFAHGFTPFIVGEALKIVIASTSLPVVWRVIARLK